MEEKTRHLFFSLGTGSVHDGVSASEPKGLEAPQQAGPDASESGRQRKAGTAASHHDNNKHRFSANFGRKEAWQWVEQPTIRTQGA